MTEKYDDAKFKSLLDEVEKLLGWLKGVEEVWYWGKHAVEEYQQWLEDNEVLGGGAEWPWTYEAPTDPVVGFGILIDTDGPGTEGRAAQLQSGATEAFANGVAWANGSSEYLYAVCDWFTKCDPQSMMSAAQSLDSDLIFELLSADLNQGLEGVLKRFYGLGADAFHEFYRDVGPKVKMWGEFAGNAAMSIAATAVLVEEAQNGLIPIAEAARDSLKKQLRVWADRENLPGVEQKAGGSIFPKTVLDVISFATSVLNLVPGPHQPATRTVGSVTGVLSKINSAAEGAGTKDVQYKTEFAGDIYDTLSEEIHRQGSAISEGTANLKIEKVGPAADHVTGLPADRWFTDRAPGVRDAKWDYDLPDPDGT